MSQDGLISFSDAATKKYGLDKYSFIVLYFDPDARQVGVEVTNDEKAEGAIKLVQRNTGAYAAGKSFVGKFDINLPATTMYDLTKDEETGFFIFDLSKGTSRRSGNIDQENVEEQ